MKQRKLNQAQHIWLAIMTELAIMRCYKLSAAVLRNWKKHRRAAGLTATYWTID